MSVDIEQSILAEGKDPIEFVSRPPFIGSVVFRAGFLRSQSLQVGSDPSPENPHHGEVWGQFTAACQRRLRAGAAWYVTIDNVEL